MTSCCLIRICRHRFFKNEFNFRSETFQWNAFREFIGGLPKIEKSRWPHLKLYKTYIHIFIHYGRKRRKKYIDLYLCRVRSLLINRMYSTIVESTTSELFSLSPTLFLSMQKMLQFPISGNFPVLSEKLCRPLGS